MIETGTMLGGYRIERVLGQGGMGVVYEATQMSLDRRVALKVLRAPLAADEAFVTRLREEGSLQASIEHPHVLEVYEVGEAGDGLFLAMRLVEGGASLADLLESGQLGAERALDLLGQAAGALDAANAAGLVHGDVKPQNILVDPEGSAYLGDFGLTRGGGDSLTASHPLLGTVAYIAPEVVAGHPAGPASDRYAFAATIFHCLTGDPVYPLGTDAAVMFAHVSSPPPHASDRRDQLPEALDGVLDRALAKEPDRRPATAAELVDSVRDAIGEGLEGLGPPRIGARAARIPPTGEIGLPSAHAPDRRSRVAVLAGAILAAAVVGAGAAQLLGNDDAQGFDTPIPEVPASAEALGSSLPEPDRSVGCSGQEEPDSEACSIAQTRLPGADLIVPENGEIVGWAVRGASGEVSLDVIRPRGAETVRVGKSQWESAGNDAPHYFRTSVPVETGDVVALELGPGSTIGIRETGDAATERWLDVLGGFYEAPDRREGTGFDYELAFRADFVPREKPAQPEQLLGAAAAEAPGGTVRERVPLKISDPPARVEIAAVEVGQRVAMDLFQGGTRRARMFVPGLLPLGQPVDIIAAPVAGEPFSEAGLWWVNPNSGRLQFHSFGVYARRFEFLG